MCLLWQPSERWRKRSEEACFAPSCLVHFRWPGPCATSIMQRLIELTFRPAPLTPRLPVLCHPLTITLVSHRLGRSENRRRSPPRPRQGTAGWCWRVERRVFGEGAEDPLFNLAQVFQVRVKAEWCPLSPCHTETFKKPPQWFLKWGVFSRDKKRERKRMSEQRI